MLIRTGEEKNEKTPINNMKDLNTYLLIIINALRNVHGKTMFL